MEEINVLAQLASALGRKDEVPNQELAARILASKNDRAIEALVKNLENKNSSVQSDCIKVLYEIGEKNARLISSYDKQFLKLLDHKNNRMVWGAMTALDCIASIKPDAIYKALPKIMEILDKGSVITIDHGVNILIQLAAIQKYSETCLVLLLDRLKICASNQLPKYAEDALSVISLSYKKEFVRVYTKRLPDFEKESKRKRLEKVIKKLQTV